MCQRPAQEQSRFCKEVSRFLAGAPGFEPGNGGIKIQAILFIYQGVFRKIAEIRDPYDQKVSGHFGMTDA
jgi:hypothetical protein